MSRRVPILVVAGVVSGVCVALSPAAASAGAGHSTRWLGAGPSSRVIVLLRGGTPFGHTRAAMHAATTAADASQRPVLAQVRAAGGHVRSRWTLIDGFAATVTAREAAALRARPDVAAVVPDRTIRVQPPIVRPAGTPTSSRTARARDAASGVCPSRPDKPLLEPEGLRLVHGDAAQRTTRGAGVRVGVVADGLDIDTPDYVRPDGTRVIADYRDFTGAGNPPPSIAGESNCDVSTIASQGRQVYSVTDYVNPAHPLPAGCTIRIRGVAPDATLYVADTVLPTNGATLSAILQGIDWVVSVDRVDVLNLSLGGNLYPDRPNDPFAMAVRAAVRAGVTVVVSTGDDGPGNTNEVPSTAEGAIAVGATTQNQMRAQISDDAFSLSNGRWLNNQIAPFSSSGVTESARTLSLVAPGDFGWVPCSPVDQCTDLSGRPSLLNGFGGTSESAPFVSGAAALVVAAYRATHHGASPTPAVVAQILTGTARDLGMPSTEQGAGLLDVDAAVKAARSFDSSDVAGGGVLTSPGRLSLTGAPGTSRTDAVVLHNTEPSTAPVRAALRTWQTLTRRNSTVIIDPKTDPTYVDPYGFSRSYRPLGVHVPVGADRLTVSFAWPGRPVDSTGIEPLERLTLLTPNGTFAGSTEPFEYGNDNWGTVEIAHPVPGDWSAVLWGASPTATYPYAGPVYVQATTYRADLRPLGTRSLAPGASTTVAVPVTTPALPGDAESDLVVRTPGHASVVPITTRSLVPVPGRFAASIGGGDGKPGWEALTQSWFFDVPAGQRDLDAALRLSGDSTEAILGYLVDPSGQVVGQATNVAPDSSYRSTLQLWHARPRAGRWQIFIEVLNPVSGLQVHQDVRGSIRLDGARVRSSGLPHVVRMGSATTVQVRIRNTGNETQLFALDPRLDSTTAMSLPVGHADPVLPQTPAAASTWIVPTHTSSLAASVTASVPSYLEAFPYYNDSPYVVSSASGAPLVVGAPEVSQGLWGGLVSPAGPFSDPVHGTSHITVSATTLAFDPAAVPADGDPWLAAVGGAGPAAPVAIAPGDSAELSMTISPTAAGRVHALVDVDTWDPALGSGDVVATVPYSYRVMS